MLHCKTGRRILSVAAWKKKAERHHEGDTSEGCARFRHVFLVCCVNAVGAVEVSISEYEDRISTRSMDGFEWIDRSIDRLIDR